MKNKLIGEYGIIETVIAILTFIFLSYLNLLFWNDFLSGVVFSEKTMFMAIFFDLISLVAIASPYLRKLARNIENESIAKFLDLPDETQLLTFPIITDFLGTQAVAAFLATAMIFTGKSIIHSYGGAAAAIYIFIVYALAIILASLSLIRIISYFTKYNWVVYTISGVMALTVLLSFFTLGLKLAP